LNLRFRLCLKFLRFLKNLRYRLSHLSHSLRLCLKYLLNHLNLRFLKNPHFRLLQMNRLSLMYPCFPKNLCFHSNLPSRLYLKYLRFHSNPRFLKNHLNRLHLMFPKSPK